LARKNTPAANDNLKRYVLEAQRLSTSVNVERCFDEPDKGNSITIKDDAGKDTTVKKGEPVVLNYVRSPQRSSRSILTNQRSQPAETQLLSPNQMQSSWIATLILTSCGEWAPNGVSDARLPLLELQQWSRAVRYSRISVALLVLQATSNMCLALEEVKTSLQMIGASTRLLFNVSLSGSV